MRMKNLLTMETDSDGDTTQNDRVKILILIWESLCSWLSLKILKVTFFTSWDTNLKLFMSHDFLMLIFVLEWVEWPLDYLVLWWRWRATGHETRSIEGSSKAMRNCMFKIMSIKIISSEINVDYLLTIGIIEIIFCYLILM